MKKKTTYDQLRLYIPCSRQFSWNIIGPDKELACGSKIVFISLPINQNICCGYSKEPSH